MAVPIPLFSISLEMKILKFHQAPLKTEAGFIAYDVDNIYLMVSTQLEGNYYTLSKDDYKDCRIVMGKFVCPHGRVVNVHSNGDIEGMDSDRCIYALHVESEIGIKTFCRYRMARKTEFVDPIDDNKFSFSSPRDKKITVSCLDNGGQPVTQYLHASKGTSTIFLPPGCSGFSGFTKFFTEDRIASPTTYNARPWADPSAVQFLASASKEQMEDLILRHKTIIDLEQDIKTKQENIRIHTHPIAIALYTIVSIILGGGFMGLVTLKSKKARNFFKACWQKKKKSKSPNNSGDNDIPVVHISDNNNIINGVNTLGAAEEHIHHPRYPTINNP